MTGEEQAAFKEQQVTAGIESLEQEEIKLEYALGNTRAMLSHLRSTLTENKKKREIPKKS